MPLRIKDIANELNISHATVSLVLNNKPGISEETRQKVLKFVEEKGYSTNLLSKPALKNNRNIRFVIYKKHGQVVSDTPFFSALMEGIYQETKKEGYNILVSYINEKDNLKTDIERVVAENPADGILLLATEMERSDIEPFNRLALPMVLLDSFFEPQKYDTVIINNRQGAFEAVKHLIDCGHVEIGYLTSSVWINNFEERKDGFMKALADHNLKFNRHYLFQVEPTMEGAYGDFYKSLETADSLPTAFFADNDIIAFGAIKALREKGFNVPRDISIVGFDDMPFCEMIDPPLTTLRVYKQRMGQIAVRRLIERIEENPEENIKVEVNTELVERRSVFNKNL